MDTLQIILSVILAILAVFIGFSIASIRKANRDAIKYDVVGTTASWEKSKIPFLGQMVIQYTRHGKPFQAATGPMRKPKHFKVGSKHRWIIYAYPTKGKGTARIAKPGTSRLKNDRKRSAS